MEKVIMGYFANPGLVKTQIAMSLGRSADDASILQREYSRWDSHGQYTVIICLRYYPSIQGLDKLTQFEALTVEDMERVFQNVAHATIEYGLKMYIRIGYLPFARVSPK